MKNFSLDIELFNNTLYIGKENSSSATCEDIKSVENIASSIKEYIQNYIEE